MPGPGADTKMQSSDNKKIRKGTHTQLHQFLSNTVNNPSNEIFLLQNIMNSNEMTNHKKEFFEVEDFKAN